MVLLPLKHGDSGTSMGPQLGASSSGSKLKSQEEKRLPLYFSVIPGIQLNFTPYYPYHPVESNTHSGCDGMWLGLRRRSEANCFLFLPPFSSLEQESLYDLGKAQYYSALCGYL